MAAKIGRISRPFLILTIILVIGGFFIFSSASLGILARDEVKFSNVAFNQLFYGLFFGSIACLFFARVDYHIWKKYSLIFFIGSILLTLSVFSPVGIEHGGAKRWIDLGFISFQPAEFLKITFIIYFAAWLSGLKEKVATFSWGLLPFLVFSGILGAILLAQPDTDTFAVVIFAALSMYIVSGAKWRHILFILLVGVAVLSILYSTRPYIKQRIEVMIHPSINNSQTSGYQLNQSLIAVGSGQVWGRGFGQSIQKFHYLPEPIGDSVFAVAAEEFGFVGAFTVIAIFIIFSLEGLKISSKAPDNFGRLMSLGIVILIVSQALINIGGMVGVLPLTGIPLPFVSHGGTALFITLIEAGIVMNISRFAKK